MHEHHLKSCLGSNKYQRMHKRCLKHCLGGLLVDCMHIYSTSRTAAFMFTLSAYLHTLNGGKRKSE